jgi:hypothetical protein
MRSILTDIQPATMKFAPTRQQLISSAMASIIFGVAATFLVVWIYSRFNGTLNDLAEHNTQNGVPRLINTIKGVVFLVVPGICACWLGLSLGVILYLNEESEKGH